MAILFVSCGFAVGQDLTTGLVASYSFDEDVIDESENDNDGTLEGGAVVKRGLLDLNGINSWVSFGAGVIPSQGNYSVAMQVNSRNPSGPYQEILSQSGAIVDFYLGVTSPNIRVSSGNVPGGDTGIPYINDGELHTLVYVINNDLQRTLLYYDGTLVKEYAFGLSLGGVRTSGFRIGRQHSNFGEYFDGQLDNLLIYDRALKPSEVVFYDSDPDYVFSGDDDSGKGLKLAKEAGRYGRVQQAVSITRGKQYRAVAEVEGDYSHSNTNKMPELRFPSRDIVFDSFNVTYDGLKTTIETIFTSDVTGDQFLTFSIWTIDEVIFRKIQLIDLETGRDLISNGNFDNGLAFWTTDGGTIDIVDLEGPTTYTLSEGLSTNGSVSGFGEFEDGTEVILTAIPDPGFVFDSWTGSASGIQNPLSITINQDRTIGASFIQDIRDTDDDGLTNYAELVEFGSDPNDNDTDNDGIADGAEVNAGLNILQPESISEAVAFLTAVRDEVIVQRDNRPTFEQLTDSRLGSVILVADAETNKVKLRFCIEESDQLGQWVTREEEAEVDIPLVPEKKFFRFSVKKD
ncbi:hypothetical protein OAL03_06850 [Akkermansiaceae bacterium]|nr:hypothetical protein [Akkermansiaceae bacterium]